MQGRTNSTPSCMVNLSKGRAESGAFRGGNFRRRSWNTISPKMITVLTRYRPNVLEKIKNCNDCNFPRRRVFGIYLKL